MMTREKIMEMVNGYLRGEYNLDSYLRFMEKHGPRIPMYGNRPKRFEEGDRVIILDCNYDEDDDGEYRWVYPGDIGTVWSITHWDPGQSGIGGWHYTVVFENGCCGVWDDGDVDALEKCSPALECALDRWKLRKPIVEKQRQEQEEEWNQHGGPDREAHMKIVAEAIVGAEARQ